MPLARSHWRVSLKNGKYAVISAGWPQQSLFSPAPIWPAELKVQWVKQTLPPTGFTLHLQRNHREKKVPKEAKNNFTQKCRHQHSQRKNILIITCLRWQHILGISVFLFKHLKHIWVCRVFSCKNTSFSSTVPSLVWILSDRTISPHRAKYTEVRQPSTMAAFPESLITRYDHQS